MFLGRHFLNFCSRNFDPSINMALVNGGFLHNTYMKKLLKNLLQNSVKILDWSKLKAFAEDKCNKNDNFCLVQAISPFPTMFSKGFFPRVVKRGSLCGIGLTLSKTSPAFYVSAVKVFWKHSWKRRNCS